MLLLLFGFVLSQEIWLTLYIIGTKLNIVLIDIDSMVVPFLFIFKRVFIVYI